MKCLQVGPQFVWKVWLSIPGVFQWYLGAVVVVATIGGMSLGEWWLLTAVSVVSIVWLLVACMVSMRPVLAAQLYIIGGLVAGIGAVYMLDLLQTGAVVWLWEIGVILIGMLLPIIWINHSISLPVEG